MLCIDRDRAETKECFQKEDYRGFRKRGIARVRDNFPLLATKLSRIKRSNLFSSARKMGYVSLPL